MAQAIAQGLAQDSANYRSKSLLVRELTDPLPFVMPPRRVVATIASHSTLDTSNARLGKLSEQVLASARDFRPCPFATSPGRVVATIASHSSLDTSNARLGKLSEQVLASARDFRPCPFATSPGRVVATIASHSSLHTSFL
jgi:hypothetical protein